MSTILFFITVQRNLVQKFTELAALRNLESVQAVQSTQNCEIGGKFEKVLSIFNATFQISFLRTFMLTCIYFEQNFS